MPPPVYAPTPAPVAVPVMAPKSRPVAPPAPMTIDIDPPVASSGPAATAPEPPVPGAGRPLKQENKPVAPIPDMGFDLTVSPEVRPAPSPSLSQVKAKQVKSSPKPTAAQMAVMAGRPGSAPPKKEPRAAPPPQVSRTANSTPQPPTAAQTAPVAPPAPMMAGPPSIPSSVAPVNGSPAPTLPQGPTSQLFTDMTFSPLVPATNESRHAGEQIAIQPPSQQLQAPDNSMTDMQFDGQADMTSDLLDMDNVDPGTDGGLMDLNADVVNGNNTNGLAGNSGTTPAAADMSNSLDEIDNLLNLPGPNSAERMDMDYELGDISLDNNNNSFEDMWYDNASGGEELGEDSFYGGN